MHYKNFINATYAPAAYLQDTPLEKIKADMEKVGRYVRFDKIYLETYRNITVQREKMQAVKKLFTEHGYAVSGGITPVEPGTLMGAMCYTNPEIRKKLGNICAYTADLFDEIMFDDFYFTNCRCELCIAARGERSWAEFRLSLMSGVSEELIKRAKEVNPAVHMIIKYPNWYESYPACGYNPEDQPDMFDSIYTGTETRDPHYPHQNLQRYLSYFLPRLMENIKPGLNGGGWYDLFECSLEDYVQQAYLTMFAKCRENMLFCFPLLVNSPAVYMAAAGAVYDDADNIMNQLGEPVGIACYKPFHSHGERHLYDYLGMLGIPLEPYPEYPENADVIILTASAAWDNVIVERICQSLLKGAKVIITSGLYKLLENRGIRDIFPIEVTEKCVKSDVFTNIVYGQNNIGSSKAFGEITIPHIGYATNDIWALSSASTPYESHPLLLCGEYGKGKMYVLNTPNNKADLYKLPVETLTLLRSELDLPVTLEAAAKIGLFMYDNNTFIISSFTERPENVRFCIKRENVSLTLLTSNWRIKVEKTRSGEGESVFEVTLMPGWYAAFKAE
jgi:hypothetical protein